MRTDSSRRFDNVHLNDNVHFVKRRVIGKQLASGRINEGKLFLGNDVSAVSGQKAASAMPATQRQRARKEARTPL